MTRNGNLPNNSEIAYYDLDEFPPGTLVRDQDGDYWEKDPSGEWNCYQFLESAPICEEYGPFRHVANI